MSATKDTLGRRSGAKAEGRTPSPAGEVVGRDILIAEVRTWVRRIGVEDRIREIHVRPIKRKWASVSTRGRLTLSQDLIKEPAEFRREVIVHELVHVKLGHGQHNKLFRSLVRAYLEDQGTR